MLLKQLLSCILIFWASVAAAAEADLVIPAAGTGPGGFGSLWQSEVTLHNAGADSVAVHLKFHTASGEVATHTLTLAAKQTVSLGDIVGTTFGQSGSITGAITIDADDVAVGKLAVTSRTFNSTAQGEFGQDIPALKVSDALGDGDTGVIAGPANGADNRFNFGIYALDAATVQWRLLRRDGSLAATLERSYDSGVQLQYSSGVSTLFASTPEDNDVVHARVLSGRLFVYGSIVNQRSGDPTYVPAARIRENLPVRLLGVDGDEDGTVDFADANGDGVLDQPLRIGAGRFPVYFRIVVSDPEGKPVTFSLVTAPGEARLLDDQGSIQMYPGGALVGTSDVLIVRVSDGIDAVDFEIPIIFR